MRILVLGGSWFLGKAVAEAALRERHDVAVFNRGRSGAAPEGVDLFRGDRTVQADMVRLADHGPWDAVIDTSASELAPRDVLSGARALVGAVRRYVYVSTVSVYRGWPDERLTEACELLDGPPDAGADYGRVPEGWSGPNFYYGRQKAGAERAVSVAMGTQRVVVLRPGVILGPGEYVGRLPWWLTRARRGGRILAPAPAEQRIQPVDVRDVARFAVDQAASDATGAFNLSHPHGLRFADFVADCIDVTGGRGCPVWAPPELLAAHGVREWTELPLWRTSAGAWAVDSSRAVAAGLVCRPLRQTIEETWAWWRSDGRPVAHPRWAAHGIDPTKEARILADLR